MQRAVTRCNYPDELSRCRSQVGSTCKWAHSLAFPSIRGSLEQIPSLWCVCLCLLGMHFELTVTNRMLSVVRVSVAHTRVSKSPLFFSLLNPSPLPSHPFNLIPYSSLRFSPSPVCPQLTHHIRLSTSVRLFTLALLFLFLAPLPPVLSPPFPPPSFQPCRFLPPCVNRSLCKGGRQNDKNLKEGLWRLSKCDMSKNVLLIKEPSLNYLLFGPRSSKQVLSMLCVYAGIVSDIIQSVCIRKTFFPVW